MKKKLIIVSILALSTLTFFSIKQTYAKYTSQTDFSDSARVAIWDVNTTVSVDLFKDSYIDSGVQSLNCEEVGDKKVCDKVVAPGTSGEFRWTITGAPETNYKMRVEYQDVVDDVKNIKFSLDGREIRPTSKVSSLQGLLNRLRTSTYNPDEVYPAGYKVDYNYNRNEQIEHVISWDWPLGEDSESDTELSKKQANLGFKLSIIIEQTTEEATYELN